MEILLDVFVGGGPLTSTGRDDNLSCFFMKQEGNGSAFSSSFLFCFVCVCVCVDVCCIYFF